MSWLRKQIKVGVGQSEFLQVEFGGPNPENAAKIVNAVVTQYFDVAGETGE